MRRSILVIGTAALVIAGTAGARNIRWDPAEEPPVSLQQAVALGDAALKKGPESYYCIGATLAKTFSSGDWELQYSSRGGRRMWVSVGSDRQVRTSVHGFDY